MSIDPEAIRIRYAEMADEELLLINRDELTSTAQQYFDREFSRRKLTDDDVDPTRDTAHDHPLSVAKRSLPKVEADWISSAFPVTTFTSVGPGLASAADARDALEAGGIPCRIVENEVDPTPQDFRPYMEYQVMVPAALALQAASTLDKALYNATIADELKNDLEGLSDSEFAALDLADLCSGLLDRVARVREVYENEAARRSGVRKK